jgi:hypothetical protein
MANPDNDYLGRAEDYERLAEASPQRFAGWLEIADSQPSALAN